MDLKALGLTDYESKAYETLIRLGKAPAASISKHSGVPYGRIYDVLAELEAKGFIKTIPGITKQYVAADPEAMLSALKKKKQELNELEKGVKELKQVYELKEVEPILVAQGKSNFYRIVKEMKEAKTFAYSLRPNTEPKPEWLREQKERLKQGIDARSLARYDKETKENVDKFMKINPNVKSYNTKDVVLSIIDSEVMIGLIKSNTTLLIRDEEFVKVMKDFFLAEYEKAKKI